MKIKSQIYAKALSDLMIEKKTPAEEKRVINNFLKLLEKNRDLKKAKEIILLAEKLFYKKTGKKKVTVQTARKVGDLPASLSDELQAGIIEKKINPELIAGIKIIINDENQLDFSLKKKLEEIFK